MQKRQAHSFYKNLLLRKLYIPPRPDPLLRGCIKEGGAPREIWGNIV
jgi:hypothetical protein